MLGLDINERVSSSFTGDVGAVALPNSWFSMDEIPKPQTLPLQEIRSRRPPSRIPTPAGHLSAACSASGSRPAKHEEFLAFSSYSCYLLNVNILLAAFCCTPSCSRTSLVKCRSLDFSWHVVASTFACR